MDEIGQKLKAVVDEHGPNRHGGGHQEVRPVRPPHAIHLAEVLAIIGNDRLDCVPSGSTTL